MWMDSHCHLDSPAFDADRAAVITRSRAQGVTQWLVPAVHPDGFMALQNLAAQTPGMAYTLGIHPCWIKDCDDAHLMRLEEHIETARSDPRFVGIGEIGLDATEGDWERQLRFFHAQLELALAWDLPVILHSRQTNDFITQALRRYAVRSGIVHAFSGSEQQAKQLLACKMMLGFGGTASFPRAARIRRLLNYLPSDAIVLETDSPDMAPAWLRTPGQHARNEPGELARIATNILSILQDNEPALSLIELASRQRDNLQRCLPRLSLP